MKPLYCPLTSIFGSVPTLATGTGVVPIPIMFQEFWFTVKIYIVFLDRSDSAHWRRDAQVNAQFIREIRPGPEPIYDRQVTRTDHLRIWRVRLGTDPTG